MVHIIPPHGCKRCTTDRPTRGPYRARGKPLVESQEMGILQLKPPFCSVSSLVFLQSQMLIFLRYGNPASLQKGSGGEDYTEFAKMFTVSFAPEILKGY